MAERAVVTRNVNVYKSKDDNIRGTSGVEER